MEAQIRKTVSLELRRQGVGPAGEEPVQRALHISIGEVTSSLRVNGGGLGMGDKAVVGLCEAILKLLLAERGGSDASSKLSPQLGLPKEWYIDLTGNGLTDRCAPHLQLLMSRGCMLPGMQGDGSQSTPAMPFRNIDPNTPATHRLGTQSTRLRQLDVSGNLFSERKGVKRLTNTRSKVLGDLLAHTTAAGLPTILITEADHSPEAAQARTAPKLGLGALLSIAEGGHRGGGSSSATATSGGLEAPGTSILGDGSIASGPLPKPQQSTTPPPAPQIVVTPNSPITPAADPRARTATPRSHRHELPTFAANTPPQGPPHSPSDTPKNADAAGAGVARSVLAALNEREASAAASRVESSVAAPPIEQDADPKPQTPSAAIPGVVTRTTVSLINPKVTNASFPDGIASRTTSTNLLASVSQRAEATMTARDKDDGEGDTEEPKSVNSISTVPPIEPAPSASLSQPARLGGNTVRRPPAPVTPQDYVDVSGGVASTRPPEDAASKEGLYCDPDVVVDGGAVVVVVPCHLEADTRRLANVQRQLLSPVQCGSGMNNITVLTISNAKLTRLPLLPRHLTRLDASYNQLSFDPHNGTTSLTGNTYEEGSPQADAALALARNLSECRFLNIINLRHNQLTGLGFTIVTARPHPSSHNSSLSHSRPFHNPSVGVKKDATPHRSQYCSLFIGNQCLVHLFIGCNQISSLDGVGHCPLLETLDVGYNAIRTEASIRPISLNANSLKHLILEGNPLLANPKLFKLKVSALTANASGNNSGSRLPPPYPTIHHMDDASSRKYRRILQNLCPSLLAVDNAPLSFSSIADGKRREWDSLMLAGNSSVGPLSMSSAINNRSACTAGGYSGSSRAAAAASAALQVQDAKMKGQQGGGASNASRQMSFLLNATNGVFPSSMAAGDVSVAYTAAGRHGMHSIMGGGASADGPFNPGVFLVTSDNGLVNSSTFNPQSNVRAPDRSAEAQKVVGAALRGGPKSNLYAGFSYRSRNETFNTLPPPGTSLKVESNMRSKGAALEAMTSIAEAANRNAADRYLAPHGGDSWAAETPNRSTAPRQQSVGTVGSPESSPEAVRMASSSYEDSSSYSSSSNEDSDSTSSSESSSRSSERRISMSPEMPQSPPQVIVTNPTDLDPPLKSNLRSRTISASVPPPLSGFRAGTPLESDPDASPRPPLTPTDVTDAFLRAISRTHHSSTAPSSGLSSRNQSGSFNVKSLLQTSRQEGTTTLPSSDVQPPPVPGIVIASPSSTIRSTHRMRSPAKEDVVAPSVVRGPTPVDAAAALPSTVKVANPLPPTNVVGSMVRPPSESETSSTSTSISEEYRSPLPTRPPTDITLGHDDGGFHPEQDSKRPGGSIGIADVLPLVKPPQPPSSPPRRRSSSTVDAADVLESPASFVSKGDRSGRVNPPGASFLDDEDWGSQADQHRDSASSTASTATTVQSTGSGEELFLKTWRDHVADALSPTSSPVSGPLVASASQRLLVGSTDLEGAELQPIASSTNSRPGSVVTLAQRASQRGDARAANNAVPPTATTTASTAIAVSEDMEPDSPRTPDVSQPRGTLPRIPSSSRQSSPREEFTREPSSVTARTAHSTGEFLVPTTSNLLMTTLESSSTGPSQPASPHLLQPPSPVSTVISGVAEQRRHHPIPAPALTDDSASTDTGLASAQARDAEYMEQLRRRVNSVSEHTYGFGMVAPPSPSPQQPRTMFVDPSSWTPQPLLPSPVTSAGVYPLLGGNGVGGSRRRGSVPAPVSMLRGQPLALASPVYYPSKAATSTGSLSPTPSRFVRADASPLPTQHSRRSEAPLISPSSIRWAQELGNDVLSTKAALRALLSVLQSQQATLLKFMKMHPDDFPASGVKKNSRPPSSAGGSELLAASYDPAAIRAAHAMLLGKRYATAPFASASQHPKRVIASPPAADSEPHTPVDQRLNHHSLAPLEGVADASYSSPRIIYGEPIVEHLSVPRRRPENVAQPPAPPPSSSLGSSKADAALAAAYGGWCDERRDYASTVGNSGLLLDTQIPESAAVELGLTADLLAAITGTVSNGAMEALLAQLYEVLPPAWGAGYHHAEVALTAFRDLRGSVVRNLRDASEGKTCLRYIGACLDGGREDLLVRYVASLEAVL